MLASGSGVLAFLRGDIPLIGAIQKPRVQTGIDNQNRAQVDVENIEFNSKHSSIILDFDIELFWISTSNQNRGRYKISFLKWGHTESVVRPKAF